MRTHWSVLPDDAQATQPLGARRHMRGHTREHFIQHEGERVLVTARVDVSLGAELLGTHVQQRTDGDARRSRERARGTLQSSCHAEVREKRTVVGEQDVLRLHVSVNDSCTMCMLQGTCHLRRDRERFVHRQLMLALQSFAE